MGAFSIRAESATIIIHYSLFIEKGDSAWSEMMVKFENSERLRRAFLIRAESASTIFHFSFFILHFNKVVRYEDLNGWVGGKRRTEMRGFGLRGEMYLL